MNRVMHFEIIADDPERLIKFYAKVFAWKVESGVLGRPDRCGY